MGRTARRGISASERLWENLHEALAPPAMDEGDLDERDLQGQLVREFLDMLTDERLVPMQPLTADELQTAWWDAWRVIEHYRDFFHACKGDIATALDASLVRNASNRGTGFWQHDELASGARLNIGIEHSDEGVKAPGYVPSRSPYIWMEPYLEGENHDATYKRLDDDPPARLVQRAKWRLRVAAVGVGPRRCDQRGEAARSLRRCGVRRTPVGRSGTRSRTHRGSIVTSALGLGWS
jgi:hypothetical protein